MKLREIVERLGCRLEDSAAGDLDILRVAGIDQAQKGDITFIANPKYQSQLATTRASAVIVGDALPVAASNGTALVRAAQPYLAFAQCLHLLAPATAHAPGIDRS